MKTNKKLSDKDIALLANVAHSPTDSKAVLAKINVPIKFNFIPEFAFHKVIGQANKESK